MGLSQGYFSEIRALTVIDRTMRRTTTKDRWKVLVVGNNPMELNTVLDRLRAIRQKSVLTEMAFDVSTVAERIPRFLPHHLLIDDNIGSEALRELQLRMPRQARGIPVTLLKNSNYHEAGIQGISNYVLKHHLSSDHLYCELLNAQLFLASNRNWEKMHNRKKGPLQRLFKSDFQVEMFW